MRHFAKSWQQRNLDSVALLSYFTSSKVRLFIAFLHGAGCPDALDLCGMDSLGATSITQKNYLNPQIALHLKQSTKVKQHTLSLF